jgi:hypothetical protein
MMMMKLLYRGVFLTLFSMLISTTATGRELSINGYPVKDFPVIKNNQGWNFNYKQKFNKKSDAVWRQLELKNSGWKQHPKYPSIRGYNGDIALKIIAPGPITQLSAQAKLTNYADKKIRKVMIAYSTNGVDYKPLAKKEFGSGAVAIAGLVKLPVNQGILWLRFSRVLEKNDSNGKYGYVVFNSIGFKATGTNLLKNKQNQIQTSSKNSQGYDLKKFFPTGAFWPWERTKTNADFAKKELWKFVEDTMKTLRDNNCNTLWFVNIGPGPDARKICSLAEKYKLKVFLNTKLLTYYYNGFDSLDNMEKNARKTINAVGDCPALMAYVLKDEPLLCNLAHCSYFYKLMQRIDPKKRDSIVIAMNRQTQSFLEESELPVICSDIYYFGHDKSTNIPNPATTSQKMFRLNVSGMNKIAAQRNKHSWLMPQMFGDVWGRHYREGDKMVVEPGSYLHWRMPTNAETRWQIWEAIRCGSKGVIFYVLFPPIPLWTPPEQVKPGTPAAKRLKRMDKLAKKATGWKRQELTQKRMKIDPGEGMLQPGGNPTPQMLTASTAFKHLRKYATLLNSRQKANFPVFFPNDAKTQAETFAVPDKPYVRYGVIVNDDLNQSRQLKVLLPLNVSTVKNLNNDRILTLKKENSVFQSCKLELAAGDGCLLEAKFVKNQPGMLLMREDFAQLTQHKVKVNRKNAKIERFGAFGIEPFYRIKMTNDASKPVFTIENLTNRKSAVNTVFMNINNRKKQGTIYCLINGSLKGVTIKGIANLNMAVKKTNVMHLAEKANKSAGKPVSRKDYVIKTDKFYTPAIIPVATTSLEFFMHAGDSINNVVIWFVPDVK